MNFETETKIYDATGELVGSREKKRGNLFNLDLSENICLSAQFEDVWLCHVNFDNLVSISEMERVRGLPRLRKLDKVMCKQCQMEKMTKSSFNSKTSSSNDILEFVHTNLYGLIGVQIYYGDKYFVDNYLER